MSMLPGIWTGDTTTHGGVLVEGEPTFTYENKASAVLVGHKFWCPKCYCWSVFVEGEQSYTVDGRAKVLQGHKASCGASAIHTQGFHYHIGTTGSSKSPQQQSTQVKANKIDKNKSSGDYYHKFHINNRGNGSLNYVVLSDDNVLEQGSVSSIKDFAIGSTSHVRTDKPRKVTLAITPPRLKI